MSKYEVPKITDARIAELLKTISPLVRKNNELWYIARCDPRTTAFSWNPKFVEQATGLVPMEQIKTLHTFGYYGFFKPSIAEVLAQIPVSLIPHVVAFEVIGPGDADDLNAQSDYVDAGVHQADTVLYTGAPHVPQKPKQGKDSPLDKIDKALG